MIKTASEIYDKWFNRASIDRPRSIVKDNIIRCMEEYSDQFKPKWIPVGERYPTETGNYLIYGRFTQDCPFRVYQALFDKKRRKFYSDGILSKNVTHWMPLPEPPKKGGANG